MSTRLLVLGVIRFMQPVHGYDVRRELVSWHLEDWANMRPGSIYSALKTLEKDGLIEAVGQDRAGGRPERTSYRITGEGEKEFHTLLRQAWWQVRVPSDPLVPALTLMPAMPRSELVAAVQARLAQLESTVDQLVFTRAGIPDGATGEGGGIPEHVRELLDYASSQLRAEIEWHKQFARRLRAGAYMLADDPATDGAASPA